MDDLSLVTLQEVTKRYSPSFPPAISRLSFTLMRGEILALLGPSGCGKTTTLRLIAGFEAPDQGTVLLNGVPMSGNGFWVPPEARRIGMVFQDYALFPHLTLAENVAFGLSGSRRERKAKAIGVLKIVGMDGMARRYPHELSGGQQQRVALARALAPGPLVILLDEPFSNLDADMKAEMRREVEKILRASGMSAILVTHDQEEAFAMADRVGVLNSGSLEQLDGPEVLYHTPATRFVADFVGEADFLPGEILQDGIVTELGTFYDSSGLPKGTKVGLMIRPDDVDFVPSEDGEAIIAGRKFRGSENRYALTLPSGTRLRSSQPSERVFPGGVRAKVIVSLVHVVVFPL